MRRRSKARGGAAVGPHSPQGRGTAATPYIALTPPFSTSPSLIVSSRFGSHFQTENTVSMLVPGPWPLRRLGHDPRPGPFIQADQHAGVGESPREPAGRREARVEEHVKSGGPRQFHGDRQIISPLVIVERHDVIGAAEERRKPPPVEPVPLVGAIDVSRRVVVQAPTDDLIILGTAQAPNVVVHRPDHCAMIGRRPGRPPVVAGAAFHGDNPAQDACVPTAHPFSLA